MKTTFRRGFSLLELMIVIAIITVMMTYALPNVLGTKQSEQLKSATDDVIDIFHYAKTRAANAFTAYGVQYTDTDGGLLEVYRGTGPDCASVDFVGGQPVKDLHFKAPVSKGGEWNINAGFEVEIEQILPSDLVQLCFTPDGRFVQAADSQPVPAILEATNYAAGEFIVTLARFRENSPVGIRHHIIVSYSGRARFTFGEDHTAADGEGY